MPWVRIDDQFSEHPKMVAIGPLGQAMQVAALCYCNLHLTDGFIPRGKVPGLIDLTGLGVTWEQVAARLLEPVGPFGPVWDEVSGGYQIHDYFEYQPSKEEVLREKQQKSEAGRRGAKARWQDDMAGAKAGAMAGAMAESCPVSRIPNPVPDNQVTEPVTPPPPKGERSKKRSSDEYTPEFERFWDAYPPKRRVVKKAAFAKWKSRLKAGADPEDLIMAAKAYAYQVEAKNTDPEYIMRPEAFLGPKDRWTEYSTPEMRRYVDTMDRLAGCQRGP